MKKRITAIALTLALTAAMIVPVSAADITQDSDPQSDSTSLTLSVAPTYTVTIPEKVELAANADGNGYSQTAEVKASAVKLEEGYRIAVNINSDCELKTSEDATYALPYTIAAKQGDTQTAWISNGTSEEGVSIGGFVTNTAEQTINLTFSAGIPEYAGDYTDTVTFTVATPQEVQ